MVMYHFYLAGTDGPLLLITACSLYLQHNLFLVICMVTGPFPKHSYWNMHTRTHSISFGHIFSFYIAESPRLKILTDANANEGNSFTTLKCVCGHLFATEG